MADRQGLETGRQGAAAMARVVEAERQAARTRDAVRAEAAEIVAAARQEARLADARVDRRIQALHGCARTALKRRQAEIDAEFRRAAGTAGVALSETEIDALVARMARRLTGLAE